MSMKKKSTNVSSILLNDNENEALFNILGRGCVTLASGVCQLYTADPPSRQRWSKRFCGVVCFVKDNPKRSYYIRLYDIKLGGSYDRKDAVIWEQEIYNQFKYKAPREYFHTFEADEVQAGLNFASEDEAIKFKNAVEQKLLERHQKKIERKKQTTVVSHGHQASSPVMNNVPAQAPVVNVDIKSGSNTIGKSKGNKKDKKKKLTKEDISTPTAFRHVSHVGWDPTKGFDRCKSGVKKFMNNLDNDMKSLFQQVGISDTTDMDKETVDFIYDFVEQHGGIEKIREEIKKKPPPPPSSHKHSPKGPIRYIDLSPESRNRATERSPGGPKRSIELSPDGRYRSVERSPEGPKRSIELSPDGLNRSVEGSPEGQNRSIERSPEVSQSPREDKSSGGQIRSSSKSPRGEMSPGQKKSSNSPVHPPPPRSSGPPPPPPARTGPPPPQRGGPPPPPNRTNLPPPPTPARQTGQPPPPPSFHAPPQPPPQSSKGAPPPAPAPGIPPPPPPPAPPAAPPPPAAPAAPAGAPPIGVGRGALLESIRGGATLKHAADGPSRGGGGASSDPRSNLLDAIRSGKTLKAVEKEDKPEADPGQGGGIVGALAMALANRQKVLQMSEDEDEDEDDMDDDDEWDD